MISRDESVCPHCGMHSPGSGWKRIFPFRGVEGGERLMMTVIWINVGFYILALFFNPLTFGFGDPLRALSPASKSLLQLGATGSQAVAGLGRWWTLVSASFLHGSLLHLIFNMIALRQLGMIMFQLFGVNRTIVIYSVSGISGFLATHLVGLVFPSLAVKLTIGASACICGMVGALLYYGKSRGGLFGEAVYRRVFGWIIGLFIIGLMPGINNWGHGGGVFGGIVCGFFLGYPERRPDQFIDRFLSVLCIIVTVLILIWALMTGFFYRFF